MPGQTNHRVSDTGAQRVLALIEEGVFKVGDKLPGQRSLTTKLGISRSSVREAVRYLEAAGVLEIRPGLGTYVISDTPYTFQTSISSWWVDNKAEVLKIFQLREALESKAAELAALNIADEMIEQLSMVLERMRFQAKQNDIKGFTESDVEFHYIVGKASNNDLLFQIIDGLQSVLMESRCAVLNLPGRVHKSFVEHSVIFDAIKRHDAKQAKKAMSVHIMNAASDVPED